MGPETVTAGGALSITEGNNQDYTLASASCALANGGTPANGSGSLSGSTLTFTPAAGENVICTFTNRPTAATKAKIILKKVTTDGSEADFSFTSSIGDFDNLTLKTVGGSDSAGPATVTGGTAQTITESNNSDYTLVSASCTLTGGGTPANGSGNLTGKTLNFTPAPGENVTCTFTNQPKQEQKPASVTLRKVTSDSSEADFSFTSSIGDFDNLTLTTVGGSDSAGPISVTGGKEQTITETNNSAYTLASASCALAGGGTPQNGSGSLSGSTLTFTPASGEDVVCTFTNEPKVQKGSITIIKKTVGGDGTFSFTGSLVSAVPVLASLTTSSGEKTSGPHELVAGTYVISEDQLTGWKLTGLTCTGDNNGSTSVASRTATINLDGRENVICTFTNTRDGSVKLTKKAIGGAGDFTFKLDGITRVVHASGTQPGYTTFENLAPGSYTIEETNLPDGWTIKDLYCSNQTGKTETSVTFNVVAGQTTQCTFTNFKKKDDKMEDVTKVFIHRRVDNLLTHEPDRARLLRRLNEEQPEGLKDGGLKDGGSLPPLKMSGQVDGEGGSVKFSTSLSRMRASYAAAQAKKEAEAKQSSGDNSLPWGDDPYLAPFVAARPGWDLWIEGQFTRYDDSTGGIQREGQFKILYVGADYAIAPGVIVGALVQVDRTDEDVNDPSVWGQISGTGWMVGPYFGAKITDSLMFDARAAWGKSSNDVSLTDPDAGYRTGSFDTDRWLVSAKLTGLWYNGPWRFSPHIGLAWGNESQDAYHNSLGQSIGANSATIGRLTFGPEFGYRTTLEDGTVIEPHIAVEGIWNFDVSDMVIGGKQVETEGIRAKVEGGVIFITPDGYKLRAAGSYDGIGDDDLEAWSVKGWLNIPLN